MNNHSYLDIEDVRIGVQISPVGSTISLSSNAKTTIIHTKQFRNFAGESPQNSRVPAGSRSTRLVFEIDIKSRIWRDWCKYGEDDVGVVTGKDSILIVLVTGDQ